MHVLTLRKTKNNRTRIRFQVNLKQLLLRLSLRELGMYRTKHTITCMRMYLSAVATTLKSSEQSERAETEAYLFGDSQTKNLRLYLVSCTAWIQSLEKTLCRSDLLPHVAFTLSKCHPAAAEAAKLSTIRRGARTSYRRVGKFDRRN